jgi:predicted Zn-dependent protease
VSEEDLRAQLRAGAKREREFKLAALCALWLAWADFEKALKQWKQAVKVYDQVNSASIGAFWSFSCHPSHGSKLNASRRPLTRPTTIEVFAWFFHFHVLRKA